MSFHESNLRSAMKAGTWRMVGTLVTIGIAFTVTRKLTLALAVGSADFFVKLGLFWAHERAWNRIGFGKREVRAGTTSREAVLGAVAPAQRL